ncbi:alpha/beta hydrolase, partial [Myxococcus sp. CA039A]
GVLALCLTHCATSPTASRTAPPPQVPETPTVASDGRVHARPHAATTEPGPLGLHPLGLGGARDGLLYVPRSYRPEQPAALMLVLHGARGNAGQMLEAMQAFAEAEGLILLIPESRGVTWDHKLATPGADLAFLDRALAHVFARYAVAKERLSVAGFSDGASYALALGILNGDLFPRILAFSPGFVHAAEPRGVPRVFISHGDKDAVLPVEQAGRRIVAELGAAGFDVRYHEFAGGHSLPADVLRVAAQWLRETTAPVSAE